MPGGLRVVLREIVLIEGNRSAECAEIDALTGASDASMPVANEFPVKPVICDDGAGLKSTQRGVMIDDRLGQNQLVKIRRI